MIEIPDVQFIFEGRLVTGLVVVDVHESEYYVRLIEVDNQLHVPTGEIRIESLMRDYPESFSPKE
ncbi:hypothetical protein [Brevibacillus sp. SYSU BS000544]|uniref:hypothetical protein n=1 Tax=Brevibacillus sp. SYSU BS000544 TaxID=3416443 RepID=UPI003CE4EDC1